jgi:hypothetical protein
MVNLARRFTASTVVLAVLAATAVLAPSASARSTRSAVLPTLYVSYAMNCTFTITDDNNARVSSIAPGLYQVDVVTPIVFADYDLTGVTDMTACQSFAQFQLTGPGVNVASTLQDGDEDKDIVTATFQPSGTYTAVDLNQPSVARVVFTTTATGTPNAPTSPVTTSSSAKGNTSTSVIGSKADSTPGRLRGSLAGSVSAAGKLTLESNGKAVSKLKSGRYTFVITDSSKKTGFVVQQNHRVAKTVTAPAYTGKKSVTLDLSAGQWFFYASFIGTKNFFIVVG